MFRFTTQKIALAAALISAVSLTACIQGGDGAQESAPTHIRVKADLGALNATSGSLAKGSAISLAKVIIVLTSNATTPAADTVRDTITPGEQGFTNNSAIDQTIDSNYTLKALRNWKVVITVLDSRDSVTHRDSITPAANNYVRIADTVVVPFGTLAPKYTQYRAIFSGLPDSVTTNAVSGSYQRTRFTRLILRVDGVIVRDSLKADYFNGLPLDTLDYDYVAPGTRVIRLAAYGSLLNAAGAVVLTDTLFVGTATINTAAGNSGAQSISLNWTNPNNNMGNEKITVTIGQVGRTTVTGITDGDGVVPKAIR
jgi:hypothetical protein